MKKLLGGFWLALRRISGDDAYERYLAHRQSVHPGAPCLGRREFYLDNENRRWSGGVQRCC